MGVVPENASTLRERNMSTTSFTPLHDRVLVKRVEVEEITSGGIIIPDTAKEKAVEGEVIAVGPGARDETGTIIPLEVKPGDLVVFGREAGADLVVDGQDRLILKEADIFGKIGGKSKARVKAA
jgi:chaperonin GroES